MKNPTDTQIFIMNISSMQINKFTKKTKIIVKTNIKSLKIFKLKVY